MLKSLKKWIMTIGIVAILVALLVRIHSYLDICCIEARNRAEYYADMIGIHPEKAKELILYETLSDKYTSRISAEVYEDADTIEEIFELYKFISDNFGEEPGKVHSMQSTDAYKCCPAGYMVIDDQYYWVEHSIDFAPNWFTFDIEVVRWNITIRETDAPTNPL